MNASGAIEARIVMQGLICAAMPGKRHVHSAAYRGNASRKSYAGNEGALDDACIHAGL